MTREEKFQVIEDLTSQLSENSVIYLADISGLNAAATSNLRRACYKADIQVSVVKNTLLAKAMEKSEKDFGDLASVLKGNTSVFYSTVANAPGKLIQEFQKKNKSDKPLFKGAFVADEVYIGADQLSVLASIKSKEELIGDIIMLLQSPVKNVISALTNEERDIFQSASAE